LAYEKISHENANLGKKNKIQREEVITIGINTNVSVGKDNYHIAYIKRFNNRLKQNYSLYSSLFNSSAMIDKIYDYLSSALM